MPKLTDKLCLVTGAARGIGKAICHAFAAEGARVVITDCDGEQGEAVAAALGCEFFALDVSREEDWAALATRYPGIDVLVTMPALPVSSMGPPHTIRSTPA